MHKPEAIYQLRPVTDNPMFEGFGFHPRDSSFLGRDRISDDFSPDQQRTRDWVMPLLKNKWRPIRVVGRVAPFNDYPCVGMLTPAFSRRAIDALRDILEPNGEILPLQTSVGDYYIYNLRTKADVVDLSHSKVIFSNEENKMALEIEHFSFHEDKLEELSIFRIVEMPNYEYVTDAFVQRVHEHGLNGFHFVKVWPFPSGVEWEQEEIKHHRSQGRKVMAEEGMKEVQGNTVILQFILKKTTPKRKEKKRINRYEDEIDAILRLTALDELYYGSLEGTLTVPGELQLHISCPDADILVRKLHPWLTNLDWDGEIRVKKRYGYLHDEDVPEEMVDLSDF